MTDPIRALCAELAAELDHNRRCQLDDASVTHPLADRARDVLARWGRPAQPAPPADGEIDQLVSQLYDYAQGEADNGWHDDAARFRRAAELLERHAAPVPVPVDRRLPGPEDCDAEGRVWLWGKVGGDWRLINPANSGVPRLQYCFSHWLPAHALPLPAPQGGEVEP